MSGELSQLGFEVKPPQLTSHKRLMDSVCRFAYPNTHAVVSSLKPDPEAGDVAGPRLAAAAAVAAGFATHTAAAAAVAAGGGGSRSAGGSSGEQVARDGGEGVVGGWWQLPVLAAPLWTEHEPETMVEAAGTEQQQQQERWLQTAAAGPPAAQEQGTAAAVVEVDALGRGEHGEEEETLSPRAQGAAEAAAANNAVPERDSHSPSQSMVRLPSAWGSEDVGGLSHGQQQQPSLQHQGSGISSSSGSRLPAGPSQERLRSLRPRARMAAAAAAGAAAAAVAVTDASRGGEVGTSGAEMMGTFGRLRQQLPSGAAAADGVLLTQGSWGSGVNSSSGRSLGVLRQQSRSQQQQQQRLRVTRLSSQEEAGAGSFWGSANTQRARSGMGAELLGGEGPGSSGYRRSSTSVEQRVRLGARRMTRGSSRLRALQEEGNGAHLSWGSTELGPAAVAEGVEAAGVVMEVDEQVQQQQQESQQQQQEQQNSVQLIADSSKTELVLPIAFGVAGCVSSPALATATAGPSATIGGVQSPSPFRNIQGAGRITANPMPEAAAPAPAAGAAGTSSVPAPSAAVAVAGPGIGKVHNELPVELRPLQRALVEDFVLYDESSAARQHVVGWLVAVERGDASAVERILSPSSSDLLAATTPTRGATALAVATAAHALAHGAELLQVMPMAGTWGSRGNAAAAAAGVSLAAVVPSEGANAADGSTPAAALGGNVDRSDGVNASRMVPGDEEAATSPTAAAAQTVAGARVAVPGVRSPLPGIQYPAEGVLEDPRGLMGLAGSAGELPKPAPVPTTLMVAPLPAGAPLPVGPVPAWQPLPINSVRRPLVAGVHHQGLLPPANTVTRVTALVVAGLHNTAAAAAPAAGVAAQPSAVASSAVEGEERGPGLPVLGEPSQRSVPQLGNHGIAAATGSGRDPIQPASTGRPVGAAAASRAGNGASRRRGRHSTGPAAAAGSSTSSRSGRTTSEPGIEAAIAHPAAGAQHNGGLENGSSILGSGETGVGRSGNVRAALGRPLGLWERLQIGGSTLASGSASAAVVASGTLHSSGDLRRRAVMADMIAGAVGQQQTGVAEQAGTPRVVAPRLPRPLLGTVQVQVGVSGDWTGVHAGSALDSVFEIGEAIGVQGSQVPAAFLPEGLRGLMGPGPFSMGPGGAGHGMGGSGPVAHVPIFDSILASITNGVTGSPSGFAGGMGSLGGVLNTGGVGALLSGGFLSEGGMMGDFSGGDHGAADVPSIPGHRITCHGLMELCAALAAPLEHPSSLMGGAAGPTATAAAGELPVDEALTESECGDRGPEAAAAGGVCCQQSEGNSEEKPLRKRRCREARSENGGGLADGHAGTVVQVAGGSESEHEEQQETVAASGSPVRGQSRSSKRRLPDDEGSPPSGRTVPPRKSHRT